MVLNFQLIRILNVLKRLQLSDEGMEIVQEQVREQVKRQTEINADRIQEVQKRINLINARLNKMFDMFLDGELEETFYNKKRDEFQDRFVKCSINKFE